MSPRGWSPERTPKFQVLFGLPGREIAIPQGELLGGSSSRVGLPLHHGSLSPKHFRITRKKFRCWIEDAGSASGTFLNGILLQRRHLLKPGDIVHVGSVCLQAVSGVDAPPPLVVNGKPALTIPLGRSPVTLGRDPGCEAILPSPDVAGRHVRLSLEQGAPRVALASDSGDTFLNGQFFDRHELVFGDRLEVGDYVFLFDGSKLLLDASRAGIVIEAENLQVKLQGMEVLRGLNVALCSDEFTGIIGPTGAGKSTLLSALSGQRRPTGGVIRFDGKDISSQSAGGRREFGWVPQDNIVHRELSIEQAFGFSALLRLPSGTPSEQRLRVVEKAASRLGLGDHMQAQIRTLSGGEVKKVSVGVELLTRPRVLFLDEPTSGLDPLAERNLMKLLRQLADSGCTVVCSTHHMQSLYLLDRLLVMHHGRLVFDGPPASALETFGVRQHSEIFHKLETDWAPPQEMSSRQNPDDPETKSSQERPSWVPGPGRRPPQLPLLLARQWAVMVSDWRNFAILLGQPVLIGCLLAWAVQNTMDDSALALFFVAVSVLWFGCSNGAPVVVSERPIYRRERMVGLRPGAYLTSKYLFLLATTLLQAALLYTIVRLAGGGTVGDLGWQCAGLTMLVFVSASLGLVISTSARTPLQGSFLVPLLMIPQIVLSGFTVPASRMPEPVRAVSEAVPLFQSQRIVDTSLLWGRRIDASVIQAHLQSMENLRITTPIKTGETFSDARPGFLALALLAAWTAAGWLVSLFFLKLRDNE